MTEEIAHKQIYIVLSQTGSILSKLLKKITQAEYNHVSISLSADLQPMYSFGRRHPYNPFWGGFVQEFPHVGTFKRFSETTVVVLTVNVSEEKYEAICAMLDKMLREQKRYHYNFIGLLFAAFHVVHKRNHHYYCSEFVRDVFLKFQIEGWDRLNSIVHPIDFLALSYTPVYRGKLIEYAAPAR